MMTLARLVVSLLMLDTMVRAEGPAKPPLPPIPVEWPMATLRQTTRSEPAAGFKAEGVEGVFFDGLPWRGEPTRVFAWVGMPKVEPGRKVPGIVLVHGGGGTAFEAWVRLWTSRGYAAIAMDTTGTTPRGSYNKWERHPAGGPGGPDFAAADQTPADQWPYHAVADVILAHSLLRSRPEVDPDRIGLTGISWGGYLACLVSGLDDRLRFVVPVYGCGFLGENSVWKPQLDKLGATGRRWVDLWDPRHYVGHGTMPKLFVSGTNDFAYPLDSLQKTVAACGGTTRQAIRPDMPHGHGGPGENPEEIRAFAEMVVNGGRPFPEMTSLESLAVMAVSFRNGEHVVRVEAVRAVQSNNWANCRWLVEAITPQVIKPQPGQPDRTAIQGNRFIMTNAVVRPMFLNFIDDRGAVITAFTDFHDQ